MPRIDKVSEEMRSLIMARVKSKGTSLEKSLMSILWRHGFRFARNNSSHFGKPDLLFKSKKLVLFIDSCFWHGCSQHLRMPTGNREYWKRKITRNIERDKEVNLYYKKLGWRIYRIWEHDVKDTDKVVTRLDKLINT